MGLECVKYCIITLRVYDWNHKHIECFNPQTCETYRCEIGGVAADTLVLNHKAISIHNSS